MFNIRKNGVQRAPPEGKGEIAKQVGEIFSGKKKADESETTTATGRVPEGGDEKTAFFVTGTPGANQRGRRGLDLTAGGRVAPLILNSDTERSLWVLSGEMLR